MGKETSDRGQATRVKRYTPSTGSPSSSEAEPGPDWVWKLKSVVRPRRGSKDACEFRVFDEAQVAAKGVTVKDYNSLDEHPDLILYQGWFDEKSGTVRIEREKGNLIIPITSKEVNKEEKWSFAQPLVQ